MANYVTYAQLDACVSPAYIAIKSDPAKYAEALAAAGGTDAGVAKQVMAQCLASLGSPITADQITSCVSQQATKLMADPAAYQQALAQAGGDPKVLAQQMLVSCLDTLQTAAGLTKPEPEKKTPWGLIIGGVAALGAIGVVGYYATRPEVKRNPTPSFEAQKFKTLRQRWLDGEVKVTVWNERDRLHIGILDETAGRSIADWWDDDAREMFEAGFFESGSGLAASVIKYATDMGYPAYAKPSKARKPKARKMDTGRIGYIAIGKSLDNKPAVVGPRQSEHDVVNQFWAENAREPETVVLGHLNKVKRGYEAVGEVTWRASSGKTPSKKLWFDS